VVSSPRKHRQLGDAKVGRNFQIWLSRRRFHKIGWESSLSLNSPFHFKTGPTPRSNIAEVGLRRSSFAVPASRDFTIINYRV
jgi:hypothetical protein